MTWTVDRMFELVTEQGASDIIFVAGTAPVLWSVGVMHRIEGDALYGADIEGIFTLLLYIFNMLS